MGGFSLHYEHADQRDLFFQHNKNIWGCWYALPYGNHCESCLSFLQLNWYWSSDPEWIYWESLKLHGQFGNHRNSAKTVQTLNCPDNIIWTSTHPLAWMSGCYLNCPETIWHVRTKLGFLVSISEPLLKIFDGGNFPPSNIFNKDKKGLRRPNIHF